MDARDFLVIADHFRASASEAERRTSVGRSYYALFNVVLGALSAKGVIFRQTPDDHHTLVSYLTKVKHRQAGSIAEALKGLRLDRNLADYDMRTAVSMKTSEFLYQKAKGAIEQFDSIPVTELNEIVRKIQAIP
ncbi:MAG: hypothetical protein Q8N47_15750 [Bryobacterales bacterium]|nr:hypothetical protein [Bryobacterales bacterium]